MCFCASAQVHYRLETRETVEAHLKSFSTKNSERETIIRNWLTEAGCESKNLSEQTLDRKLPPNVICVAPGETDDIILVSAHTDHVDNFGDGVVDNWTGAALLPSLLYSLSDQERHHTFVFVGFSAEEKGLVGSAYYANHLSPEQRARIRAVVNIDSLGLTPLKVWASHADHELLEDLARISASAGKPIVSVNIEGGSADSESFARYQIPRITLHSVTQETISVLHSPRDKLTAVHVDDYYDSYRLIAQYLAYLDNVLAKPSGPNKASLW
jgi:putative aminopeptidase FrvX